MKNFEIKRLAVFVIILSFFSSSCLTEDPLKMPFQSYAPPDLGDGWKTADPASVGIDKNKLEDVYRYVHGDDSPWQIRSLLVFKDGKLVAESYTRDTGDRTTPRAVWSCTKQFVGILTGIAVDDGKIKITDTIEEHLPQVSGYPDKKDITIENLLMMKSGIAFENDGHDGGPAVMAREEPSSSLDYIFGLNMYAERGTHYKYKDGDPFIISAILQEKYGKPMRDWAQEVLFDRIGIKNLTWLNYKDGITFGGYGIKTTPRELGKIGQLVLNKGKWDGEIVVSEDWIDEMTKERTPDTETGSPDLAFCYQWWKDTKRNINMMWGRGGQLVYINKDKDLIVVITSETNTSGDFGISAFGGLSIYDQINEITTK